MAQSAREEHKWEAYSPSGNADGVVCHNCNVWQSVDNLISSEVIAALDRVSEYASLCDMDLKNPDKTPRFIEAVPLSAITAEKEKWL